MATNGDPKFTQVNTTNTNGVWGQGNAHYVGDPIPANGYPNIFSPNTYQASPLGPPWIPSAEDLIHQTVSVDDPALNNLIEMLELEPSEDLTTGLCLEINGARYSLLDILHAQMQFMFRMNILLIHRQLGRANED